MLIRLFVIIETVVGGRLLVIDGGVGRGIHCGSVWKSVVLRDGWRTGGWSGWKLMVSNGPVSWIWRTMNSVDVRVAVSSGVVN